MLGLGTFLNFKVYNVFIASLLNFMLQFYAPSPEMFAAEERVLRGMMRGKANWITPAQILHMKSWYNFPKQPISMEHIAIAAKVRLFEEDIFFKNGVGQSKINETLNSGQESGNCQVTLQSYGSWIHGGIFKALQLAHTRIKGTPVMGKIKALKRERVREEVQAAAPGPESRAKRCLLYTSPSPRD